MSEQYLSIRSKTCTQFKKNKLFLAFAGQKPKSARAGPAKITSLTGSMSINKNTKITAHEVEHKGTVNTKKIMEKYSMV